MNGHRAKLIFAVNLAVRWVVRNAKGIATFVTFTFKDNVVEKKEAARRWRRLKERLRRRYPDLNAVGIWQRQRRGAWHLHFVSSLRMDVVVVRAMAEECGFGRQLNMRAIGELPGMRQGWTVEKVANYITRYISRDVDEADRGVRVAEYMGHARVASTRFGWYGGMSKLWRLGRDFWSEMFGMNGEQPHKNDMDFIIQLGWASLNEEERCRLRASSDAVARWFDPEAFPF